MLQPDISIDKLLSAARITLSGEIGSGKSSVGKILCSELDIPFLSTGTIQREIASNMGMSTLELNLHAEKDPAIDKKIDQFSIDLEARQTPCIVDSRLAWNFMPTTFKVYLLTDPDVAVKRVSGDHTRLNSESYKDLKTARKEVIERGLSERRRFLVKYHVDLRDFNNYNLVLDSTHIPPEQVCALIKSEYIKYQKNKTYSAIWVSPRRLFPLEESPNYSLEKKKVVLINSNSYFFIYAGHERCSDALSANQGITPAIILGEKEFMDLEEKTTKESYLASHYKEELVKKWESKHKFTFTSYPETIQK